VPPFIASRNSPALVYISDSVRMAHLTLTKSNTSRISRPSTRTPIKKTTSFDLKARKVIDPTEKPEPQKRETAAQKLEVTQHHVPAGSSFLERLTRPLTFNKRRSCWYKLSHWHSVSAIPGARPRTRPHC
jgi:hypothetical protein